MQFVAGVEETDVVARGEAESLVHGIVQTAVRFTHHFGKVLAVDAGHLQCAVLRRTVDEDVLDVRIGLFGHTLQGAFQRLFGVVGDGDEGEGWVVHGILSLFYIVL